MIGNKSGNVNDLEETLNFIGTSLKQRIKKTFLVPRIPVANAM